MQLSPSVTKTQRQNVDLLEINTELANATISLFGAQLLQFTPKADERERIWLSDAAVFDGKTPIRGGVPVCWPWFSDAHGQADQQLPSHGFVRTQNWQVTKCSENEHCVSITMEPESTTGSGWPHPCELQITFRISKTITIELQTSNQGSKDLNLSQALHSYFKIADINSLTLNGLHGVYKDKTRDWQTFETPSVYTFSEETDRIHLVSPEKVTITDSHTTEIMSNGHDSIVVWNPWQENCRKMTDMHDDAYKHMLCVESAITQDYVLKSGQTVRLVQEIA